MKLNDKLKIRDIAGESVVLMPAKDGKDMTRVLALNSSSRYLWDTLSGKEFEAEDVVKALLDRYEVEEERAREDAAKWIAQLVELGVLA